MNKKIIRILLLSLIIPITGISQDKIYFLDGKKEETYIQSIDADSVKYKKYNNPGGPVYITAKKEIAVIEYADGEYLIFKRTGILGFSYDTVFTKKNILSAAISPLLLSVGLSYERIISGGNWGVRVPMVFGNFYSPLFAGLGLAYYPKGQEKYTLYLSGDFFYSFPYVFSGIAFSTGFRANWNQKFAITLEIGGNLIIKNKEIVEILFPGILTPALNFSYRFNKPSQK